MLNIDCDPIIWSHSCYFCRLQEKQTADTFCIQTKLHHTVILATDAIHENGKFGLALIILLFFICSRCMVHCITVGYMCLPFYVLEVLDTEYQWNPPSLILASFRWEGISQQQLHSPVCHLLTCPLQRHSYLPLHTQWSILHASHFGRMLCMNLRE